MGRDTVRPGREGECLRMVSCAIQRRTFATASSEAYVAGIPELWVTTPRDSSALLKRANAWNAPRDLKAPIR